MVPSPVHIEKKCNRTICKRNDKVVLTFNYSGDNRVMTLHKIDGGLGHSVCIPSGVVYQKRGGLLASSFLVHRKAGLERAAPVRTLVQKLRAGEQFLARGRIH